MKDTDTSRTPEDIARAFTLLERVRDRAIERGARDTLALCVDYRRARRDLAEARAELGQRRPVDPTGDGRTHWLGCWVEHGHHACAIAEVERLQAARLRGIDQPDSPPTDEVSR